MPELALQHPVHNDADWIVHVACRHVTVITCATGKCGTLLPLSAIARTMSRSDRMLLGLRPLIVVSAWSACVAVLRNLAEIVLAHACRKSPKSAALPLPISYRDERDWIEDFVAKNRRYRIEPITQAIAHGTGDLLVSTQRILPPEENGKRP